MRAHPLLGFSSLGIGILLDLPEEGTLRDQMALGTSGELDLTYFGNVKTARSVRHDHFERIGLRALDSLAMERSDQAAGRITDPGAGGPLRHRARLVRERIPCGEKHAPALDGLVKLHKGSLILRLFRGHTRYETSAKQQADDHQHKKIAFHYSPPWQLSPLVLV